jgi:hypothetical protein
MPNGDTPQPNQAPQERNEERVESPTTAWTVEVFIFVLILLSAIVYKIGGLDAIFSNISSNIFSWSWVPPRVLVVLRQFVVTYVTFVTVLSLFFLVGIVYSLIRWRQWAIEWQKLIYPSPGDAEKPAPKNEKWERVQEHLRSDNPSDWRLAILEADIVLDEMLDSLGYIGDTIGDKLKKAKKGDFQTIDQAWEAHKIRNAIAHQGQDFTLTQREAQRIVGLYKQVFEEFDYI